MLNWFAKKNDAVDERRLTRFEQQHTRDVPRATPLYDQIATPEPAMPRVRTVDVVAPRPIAEPAPTPAPNVNLAEHLHSDDKISTSLLRRALPMRFADLDEEKMAASGQDADELRFAFG